MSDKSGQCCNTCDELLVAYSKKNWDTAEIQETAEQCMHNRLKVIDVTTEIVPIIKEEKMVVENEEEEEKETCGSCYGAHEHDGDCCDTCDELLATYKTKGWDYKDVQQTARQCTQQGDDLIYLHSLWEHSSNNIAD